VLALPARLTSLTGLTMQSILLVEDDIHIAADLKSQLSSEGFDVEVLYDGLLAEKLILRKTFHCIILDVNIPGKNGFDVCASIRAQHISTPVLMLTAFGEVEDKIQGFERGADDYLTKPFFFKELLARIRALLKRGSQREDLPQALIIEDLTIDLSSKKVTRNGILVKLTAREFEIISTLATAKGNVVSKKELIQKIWGTTVQVNTNTIEVFINSLRNKIDKNHSTRLLHTRQGFGYYLSIESDEASK
jgi:DNA-binding response OmpR family regulator